MPLRSGKGSFKTNVRTLMGEIGKSPHVQSRAQALAIAYSKERGHADGGMAMDDLGHPVGPITGSQDAADPIIRRFGYGLLKGMMRQRMGLDSGPFTQYDDTATPQQNARMNRFGQPATADQLRNIGRQMEIEGRWNNDTGQRWGAPSGPPGSIGMAEGGPTSGDPVPPMGSAPVLNPDVLSGQVPQGAMPYTGGFSRNMNQIHQDENGAIFERQVPGRWPGYVVKPNEGDPMIFRSFQKARDWHTRDREEPPPMNFDQTTIGSGRGLADYMVPVNVDPRVLNMAYKATDPEFANDLSAGKMSRLKDFVAAGNPVSMADIGVHNGRLGFTNGRHRAQMAADLGMTSMPVAVDKQNIPELRDLLRQYQGNATNVGFAPGGPVTLSQQMMRTQFPPGTQFADGGSLGPPPNDEPLKPGEYRGRPIPKDYPDDPMPKPRPIGPQTIFRADGGELPDAPIGAYGADANTLGPLTSAVGQSLMSRMAGTARSVGQAATAPGRAYSGQLGDETGEALNMAQVLMGAGLMGAPGGSAGLFGGVLSKGADLDALSNARLLESAGLHRDVIWKQTGWGRDPTGKWFYEIPDNKAGVFPAYKQPAPPGSGFRADVTDETLADMGIRRPASPTVAAIPDVIARQDQLGRIVNVGEPQFKDVIHHPELRGTYPDIEHLSFGKLPQEVEQSDPAILGGYQPPPHEEGLPPTHEEGFIFKNKMPTELLGSSALHEAQHAIQNREGFPAGSNPMEHLPPNFGHLADLHNQAGELMTKDLNKLGINPSEWGEEIVKAYQNGWKPLDREDILGGGGLPRGLLEALFGDEHIQKFNKEILPKLTDEIRGNFDTLMRAGDTLKQTMKQAQDAYHRTAGEVQSRNVQRRWQMTPEERRASPPWKTQDVPDIQQITRADGGGTPWTEKAGYRTLVHEGFLHAPTPGRTDTLHIGVPSGAYVVPSSVVSALGQDNSLAGSRVLNGLFSRRAMAAKMTMGMRAQHANKKIPGMAMQKSPNRIKLPSFAQGGSLISRFARADGGGMDLPNPFSDMGKYTPTAPTPPKEEGSEALKFWDYSPKRKVIPIREMAAGGTARHIPIIAAGGEYIIHPSVVAHLGGGDIEKGHRILDKFVVEVRKKHIKTLKKLPGPKKA